MRVNYVMIPCSGFRGEVQSVNADENADAARISHPPPFRRVTKNEPTSAYFNYIIKSHIIDDNN